MGLPKCQMLGPKKNGNMHADTENNKYRSYYPNFRTYNAFLS